MVLGNRDWAAGRQRTETLNLAGYLQRIEGIAASRLVNAHQHWAGKRRAEFFSDQLVYRSHTQWADGYALYSRVAESGFDDRKGARLPRRGAVDAECREQPNVATVLAMHCEPERARRSWIEPLGVIHGQQERSATSEVGQQSGERGTHRARFEITVARIAAQRCHLERPSLRQREGLESLLRDRAKKVGQTDIG